MFLRSAIEEINGFRFMIDKLEIQSGLAKRVLNTLPYLRTAEAIAQELDKTEVTRNILQTSELTDTITKIKVKLMQVKDVRGTANRVTESQILDDIELFELKAFSLLVVEMRELLLSANITVVTLPDLEPVVNILDPEKMRIPHFYVYDAYSPELAALRAKMKTLKMDEKTEERVLDQLQFEHTELEDRIREKLSEQIHPYKKEINEALVNTATLDILLAKAQQTIDMQLCKPEISTSTTRYIKIFNPQVKEVLWQEGKKFQAIDIDIKQGACLITGANMAGKSVILKTVALAQTLFQFGFYVPAEQAEIALVDEVLLCIGDEQSELSGLSSYASEMLRVNAIVQDVKAGKNALILIDELARTTNPTEGKAIVNAMLDFLTDKGARSLITSHYSGIKARCKKMRVKGFVKEHVQGQLTINNINEFIDYSLIEDTLDSVPQEAMRIARILGVDEELLDKAEEFLDDEEKKNRN